MRIDELVSFLFCCYNSPMNPSRSSSSTSRNFLVAVVLVLLVLAVVVVLSLIEQRSDKAQTALITEPSYQLDFSQEALAHIQEAGEQDTDGDGLLDWEEALWGTDPMLVDTNDDGVSDYDEVKQVKEQIADDSDEAQAGEPQELEPIDTISRDLYSTLAYLDQQGELNEYTESQVQGLFQETILQSFEYEPVGIATLALVDDSSRSRVEYMREIEGLLTRYPFQESDFIFVANSSESALKSDQAIAVIEKYQGLLGGLIELETPVGLQAEHLSAANAVGQLGQALEGLLYADLDPLTGLSSGVILPVAVAEYHNALVALYAANGQDISAQ